MPDSKRDGFDLAHALAEAVSAVRSWEDGWGPSEGHPTLGVDADRFARAWSAYSRRLGGNYPFFHPRYAGQMLKPPHPAAVVGYLAAMLINPNNHALDGGPPTSEMEKEVVRELARMFRLPDESLGHLTSSGTLANLEALWVARNVHPDRGVAFSSDAHYTHARMSDVLGLRAVVVDTDEEGRIDLNVLEDRLREGDVGTVVLTAGTTGYGLVDPIDEAMVLKERYGVRIHVDAAYGGFFTLLAYEDDAPVPAGPFRAIAGADSVAVDPHKHGLQPYGCGGVLFRDPGVGRFYRHDSPYTYFTSSALHLGEISLECSRAGAAAGALWFTLRCLPLRPDEGLGPILRACLRAARTWAGWIERSDVLWLFQQPELDIVTFFPAMRDRSMSALDRSSRALFEKAMADPDDPVFLSVLQADLRRLRHRVPDIEPDAPSARMLRSVLMKPEHESYVGALHERVERLALDLLVAG